MNKMNALFILIGDPRLEGGSFYLDPKLLNKGLSM